LLKTNNSINTKKSVIKYFNVDLTLSYFFQLFLKVEPQTNTKPRSMFIQKNWNFDTSKKLTAKKNSISKQKAQLPLSHISLTKYNLYYSNFYYQNTLNGVNKLNLLYNFKLTWLNFIYKYLYLYNINFYNHNYLYIFLLLNSKNKSKYKIKDKSVFLLNHKYL